MEQIIRPTKLQLQEWRDLQITANRYQYGQLLVEGLRAVQEFMVFPDQVVALVFTEAFLAKNNSFVRNVQNLGIAIYYVTPLQMKRLTTTKTPAGIVAIVTFRLCERNELLDQPFVPLLDRIADPGNLGTIIRTADWFGVKAVMVTEGGGDPFQDKVVRAAMGALCRVKIYRCKDVQADLRFLKQHTYSVALAEAGGESSGQLKKPLCLVFGNEAHGISAEITKEKDQVFSISGAGTVESLNVGVAFGIAAHHYFTNNI